MRRVGGSGLEVLGKEISRREFIASASSAIVGCTFPMESSLRFLVASDIHYRPGVFPHDSVDWLERIVARGMDARVDFGLQLGDFIHDARAAKDFIACWRKAPFATYSVLGNHDSDSTTPDETHEVLGLERGFYRFDVKGWRFLVLDTNWALIDGIYRSYGRGCGFSQHRLAPIQCMRLHPDEFVWLGDELARSPFPCVIVSHVCLSNRHPDGEAIGRLMSENPGKVRLMLCGHAHCDRLDELNGVPCLTVNSANHHWVPRTHGLYPEEDTRRWCEINHIIAYDSPLSAIVTLTVGGEVRVEGHAGGFWRGIDPERAGFHGLSASIIDRTIYPRGLKGVKSI